MRCAGSAFAVFTFPIAVAGCRSAQSEPIGTAEHAQIVCASGATLEGVDVSKFQQTVDWTQVKASGRAFGVAQTNDGVLLDDQFDANWAGMQAAGLVRGAYQFFEPAMDPGAQADIAISKVGALGVGDLPVTLDVEIDGGKTPDEIAAEIHTWVDKITPATGRIPILYTGKYFWNVNVASFDFAGLPLWIASYGVSCPDTPDAWTNWTLWQYTSTGSVPGINASADLDVFNGDASLLDQLAGTTYAAQYVSETYAATMMAGASAPAKLVLKNVGGRNWDGSTRLATTMPRDRASAFAGSEWIAANRIAAVAGTIVPGDTYEFDFTLHAPLQPGMYVEHWNLVEDGVAWFSDPGEGGPTDDAIWFQITVTGSTSSSATGGGSSTTGPGASTSSAGGSATSASSGDGGGSGALAAADSETSGGCSCELARRPFGGWALLALGGATAALLSRRSGKKRCRSPRAADKDAYPRA